MTEINDPVVDERRNGKPWVTSSGLVVGGAYRREMPQPSQDAEKIQAAMLNDTPEGENYEPLWEVLAVWFGIWALALSLLYLVNPDGAFDKLMVGLGL